MKKLLLTILFLISFTFIAGKSFAAPAQNPVNPDCLGMEVLFTATNWPKNATMDIACAGNTRQVGCVGKVISNIKPDPKKRHTLGTCTCPNYADGCLKIGQNLKLVPHYKADVKATVLEVEGTINPDDNSTIGLPKNCRIVRSPGKFCGTNGHKITPEFRIICEKPKTSPSPTKSPTPSPTIPVVTSPACPVPGIVANVKITCPNCLQKRL